jgi:Glycosyl transferases group 1
VRAVYFTVVPLFPSNSGGALCCRNHVRRLARDPSIELLVCMAGPPEHEEANRQAVESLGAEFVFLPFCTDRDPRNAPISPARRIARRWPFIMEAEALDQPEIDAAVLARVRAADAQAVIVDYLPSASYVRSLYSARVRRVTITHNLETAYYRDLRKRSAVPPNASSSWLANARVAQFERWVYRRSDAVVALSDGDLPTWRGRPDVRTVMPSVFDPSPSRWRHTGARTLFFVGNVAHDSNLRAIEWLATRLAPELEVVDRDTEIRIIGADPESVPTAWLRPNVSYLGHADDTAVTHEFITAGIFIAPIANAYGSKIKLLDCLSHATPFVATAGAKTGLPFISSIPQISLDHPRTAAELIANLLSDGGALEETSDRLSHELSSFIEQERGSWGRLLRGLRGHAP